MLISTKQPFVNVYRSIMQVFFPDLSALEADFTASTGLTLDTVSNWYVGTVLKDLTTHDKFTWPRMINTTAPAIYNANDYYTSTNKDIEKQINIQHPLTNGVYEIVGVYINYMDSGNVYADDDDGLGNSASWSNIDGPGILVADLSYMGKRVLYSPSINLQDRVMAFGAPY